VAAAATAVTVAAIAAAIAAVVVVGVAAVATAGDRPIVSSVTHDGAARNASASRAAGVIRGSE
jgi:hypothetical protein